MNGNIHSKKNIIFLMNKILYNVYQNDIHIYKDKYCDTLYFYNYNIQNKKMICYNINLNNMFSEIYYRKILAYVLENEKIRCMDKYFFESSVICDLYSEFLYQGILRNISELSPRELSGSSTSFSHYLIDVESIMKDKNVKKFMRKIIHYKKENPDDSELVSIFIVQQCFNLISLLPNNIHYMVHLMKKISFDLDIDIRNYIISLVYLNIIIPILKKGKYSRKIRKEIRNIQKIIHKIIGNKKMKNIIKVIICDSIKCIYESNSFDKTDVHITNKNDSIIKSLVFILKHLDKIDGLTKSDIFKLRIRILFILRNKFDIDYLCVHEMCHGKAIYGDCLRGTKLYCKEHKKMA